MVLQNFFTSLVFFFLFLENSIKRRGRPKVTHVSWYTQHITYTHWKREKMTQHDTCKLVIAADRLLRVCAYVITFVCSLGFASTSLSVWKTLIFVLRKRSTRFILATCKNVSFLISHTYTVVFSTVCASERVRCVRTSERTHDESASERKSKLCISHWKHT